MIARAFSFASSMIGWMGSSVVMTWGQCLAKNVNVEFVPLGNERAPVRVGAGQLLCDDRIVLKGIGVVHQRGNPDRVSAEFNHPLIARLVGQVLNQEECRFLVPGICRNAHRESTGLGPATARPVG